jgi:hypothetical protein
MNARNLFISLVLLVGLIVLTSPATFAQTTLYLNVTNGDDSYSGVNPINDPPLSGPKRTISGIVSKVATLTAGTTVTVRTAAGEYSVAPDNAGVTIGGNYNYIFVDSLFNTLNTVTIPANLTIAVSAGRTVTWKGVATPAVEGVTVNNLILTTGVLDVSGLANFTVTGGSTVTRAAGSITGTVTHGDNNLVVFTGTGNKTAGSEVPAYIGTGSITVNQTSGTVTFGSALAATTGGIVLTSGNATFSGALTFTPGGSAGAGIVNNSTSGALVLSGAVTVKARSAQANYINNNSTGTLSVTGALSFVNSSASGSTGNATATILNNSTGTLNITGGLSQTTTTVSSVDYTFVVDLTNTGGTVALGGGSGTTVNGNVVNNTAGGHINLAGSVLANGNVSNAAALAVIALGSNNLTVKSGAAQTVTNTGSITSSGIGTGILIFDGDGAKTLTGGGSLPNIQRIGKGALGLDASARAIAGDVVNNNSTGNITIGAAAHTISGAITNTAGLLNINGATTVQGGVNLNGGTTTLGANLTVNGSFSQVGGAFDYGTARTLELKGNFNRISGTVTPNTGRLLFSASGGQVFSGGANYAVYDLETSSIGTSITLGSSVIVNHNATIGANTSMVLGTFNIRMAGDAGQFTLSGTYSSSAGGGIIFEAPTADQTITGVGIFSNIEVRLGDITKHVIVPNGQTVTFSGALIFSKGGIAVGATDGGGAILNPSNFITTPTISVNLGGAPDGKGITVDVDNNAVVNGSFNTTAISYNLTYFGALTANRAVGAEFVSGATPRVINLSITTSGAHNVLTTDAEYRISGALSVSEGATFALDGTASNNFVVTGNNVTHDIKGTIVSTGPGTHLFRVIGSSVTIAGSSSTTASHTSKISATEIASSGLVTVSNLKEFTGNLALTTGELTLGLAKVTGFATSGQITGTYTQSAGTQLNLGADLVTDGVVTVDGTIDFVNFNWTAKKNFTAASTTTFQGTPTSTSNGFLIFGETLNADFAGVVVPRVKLGAAAAGKTVTLLSNLEVSDMFVQSRGTLDLGALALTISGATWTSALDDNNDATYEAVTFLGTGTVNVTGNTTVTMNAALTVPNLTINTNGSFTLATNDLATPTYRKLTVGSGGAGVFTMTLGTLELGSNDIELQGGASGFVYSAGSINATTSSTLAGTIGEVIFNHASLTSSPASGLVIPNLTVNAAATVTTASGVLFTVSKRLTLGAVLTTSDDSRLTLADSAWIVSTAAVDRLSKIPAFGSKVNLAYTTVTQSTAKEMPTTGTVLNNLYVDPATGNTVTLTAATTTTPVVVNGTLTLASGTLTYGATRPLQLVTGGAVVVMNNSGTAGKIDATAGVPALAPAGAYTLTYTGNGGDVEVTTQEWPTTATITTLNVTMGKSTSVAANYYMYLDANNRAVNSLVMNAATTASGLKLVNLTGTQAARNLTVSGPITITKGTIYGVVGTPQLVAQGDVNMTGGSFSGSVQLTFSGAVAQAFTLGSNQTVANLTISKTGTAPVPSVTLSGGNLTVTGTMTFVNGLFVTGSKVLVLAAPAAPSQGFDRTGVIAPNISHVVGNVRKTLANDGDIVTSTNERSEFPVGTALLYRPVAITFKPNFGIPTVPNGVSITIDHLATKPTGAVGLPIVDGVSSGVSIARYADFYWNIISSASIGNTKFDLELTAKAFSDFDAIENVRIIRRLGTSTDIGNPWSLQGAPADYDNFVASSIPTVVNVNSIGGIRPEGGIFTYGLKSTLFVQNPIGDISFTGAVKTQKIPLVGVFGGTKGTVTYSATSSNNAIVTAVIAHDTLTVHALTQGEATVTVKIVDSEVGQIETSFTVGSTTGVAVVELPKEFSLKQNYPNPFNPTTNIMFGIPQNSSVKIAIYDMLGREVAVLVNANYTPGYYTVPFNASRLASGMYIYRMSSQSLSGDQKMFTSTKKLMLVK